MGCDIHTIAQIKKNNKWVTVKTNIADHRRCYPSFAILADVRNRSVFMGDPVDTRWTPIAQPRSFPIDLIPDIHDEYRINFSGHSYFLGDHSHSWLLATEIEHYIKHNLPTHHVVDGFVTASDFLKFFNDGVQPSWWCRGVCGTRTRIIGEKEALDKNSDFNKQTVKTEHPLDYYVYAKWKVIAKTRVGCLLHVSEELEQIANEEKVPKMNVRLVFGFDS